MKQKLFIIVAMVLLMPIGTYGQTYKELWKQVEQAQDRDLPKTAISVGWYRMVVSSQDEVATRTLSTANCADSTAIGRSWGRRS